MKKLLVKSLFLCVAFFSLRAEGQLRPEANSFGFEVDFLYFKPVFDFSYYVIGTDQNSPTTLSGARHANEFDYHGGYALGAIYVFCNEELDLRLKWTHFQETAIDEVKSNAAMGGAKFLLSGSFSPVNDRTALSQAKFQYDAIDFLLGYIPIHCTHFLSLHVGVQYASIKYVEEDTFIPTLDGRSRDVIALGEWDLKMEGVGPELGLLYKYLLPKCLFFPDIYLDAKAKCGAVIGKITADVSYFDSANPTRLNDLFFDISNEKTYRVVPFWDLALGISSQCSFHSFLLEFEVGYEFINYRKALDGVECLFNPVLNPSQDFFSDVMLHGLYFSAGITY